MRQRVAELDDAQQLADVLAGDGDAVPRAVFDHPARNFTADIADLALQVANAGLTGESADNAGDGIVGKADVLFRQACGLALLADQILLGDLQLFRFGVTVQPQNFHAVLQRSRDGMQHVGGSDKEDLRKVVFHVEVMIHEAVVLLRIKDFQQGR